MRRSFYRTVRNNRIRLCGKVLSNENLKNGELDGYRFSFYPYSGQFEIDGLTALWGTEIYAKAVDEADSKGLSDEEMDKVTNSFYEADRKLLAPDGVYQWYFWKEIKTE